jgi:hypothetical protein
MGKKGVRTQDVGQKGVRTQTFVFACMHARTCARACVFESCMHARASMCDTRRCMEAEERRWDRGGQRRTVM